MLENSSLRNYNENSNRAREQLRIDEQLRESGTRFIGWENKENIKQFVMKITIEQFWELLMTIPEKIFLASFLSTRNIQNYKMNWSQRF